MDTGGGVWPAARAMAYAVELYKLTTQLPSDERYNLTVQLRKAVASVPLNIAEGSGCASSPEFVRFLGYAYRSLKEVVTGLELCQRLYPSLPSQPLATLIEEGNQISGMIHSLIQRVSTGTGPSIVRLATHDSELTTRDIKGEALG